MLNREQSLYIAQEAHRLGNLTSKAIGRKLRRFLGFWTAYGVVSQTLSYNEGHTPEQLTALRELAQQMVREQQEALEGYMPGVIEFESIVFDEMFGLVAIRYSLKQDPATASVAQLRSMVEVVQLLAEAVHVKLKNVNSTVFLHCPEYVYRGLPCSIAPDETLWCVSGSDIRGGSGVLEWCYDEQDAKAVLADMSRFPERFHRLSAHAYAKTEWVQPTLS